MYRGSDFLLKQSLRLAKRTGQERTKNNEWIIFNKINKPYLYFIQKNKFILIIITMVLFAACKARKVNN